MENTEYEAKYFIYLKTHNCWYFRIAAWCDDVFLLIKKVSRQFLKPQNEVQGHGLERQLCVDALYQLIQVPHLMASFGGMTDRQ